MAKKKENSLKWCYIGENKDQVMMVCSKEDWEAICDIVEWAKKQSMLRESDNWNYSYTAENR